MDCSHPGPESLGPRPLRVVYCRGQAAAGKLELWCPHWASDSPCAPVGLDCHTASSLPVSVLRLLVEGTQPPRFPQCAGQRGEWRVGQKPWAS